MLHEFFETGTYWNCLCECYKSSLKLTYIEFVYVNVTWVLWNWYIMKRLFMWMLHEVFETGVYWNCSCNCYMSSLELAHNEIVYVNVTWSLWNWHILKLFMWMLHEFFETGIYIEIVYVNVTWVLWNWHEFFETGIYIEIVYVNVTWVLWNWHEFFGTGT
jgi:hypothetical protein